MEPGQDYNMQRVEIGLCHMLVHLMLPKPHEVLIIIVFDLERQESRPKSLFVGLESQCSTPDVPDSRTCTLSYYVRNLTKINGLQGSLDAVVQNGNWMCSELQLTLHYNAAKVSFLSTLRYVAYNKIIKQTHLNSISLILSKTFKLSTMHEAVCLQFFSKASVSEKQEIRELIFLWFSSASGEIPFKYFVVNSFLSKLSDGELFSHCFKRPKHLLTGAVIGQEQ